MSAQRQQQRRAEHQRAGGDVERVDDRLLAGEDDESAERDLGRDRGGEQPGWTRELRSIAVVLQDVRDRHDRPRRHHQRAHPMSKVNRNRRATTTAEAAGRTSTENPESPVRRRCGASSRRAGFAGRRGRSARSIDAADPCRATALTPERFHPRDVNSARLTVRQKKICARPAWLIEIASGRKNKTVKPPSAPCRITAPSAIQPSSRTHARGSRDPEPGDQADGQEADGRRDQPVAVLVEDPADHVLEREREHVLAVGRRPVRHRQPGIGARHHAAGGDEDQRARRRAAARSNAAHVLTRFALPSG